MDQLQHRNLQILSQFSRYQFLKKITQLLLSVSVFSFLLSNSSRLSFLHPFNFSSVPVQLFSRTIDKNCIFLLCNGLLVFVAKFSGSISSSSVYNNHSSIESVENYEDDAPTLVLDQYSKVSLLEKEDLMAQGNVSKEESRENDEHITREAVERETKQFIVEDEAEERDSGFSITTGNKEGSEEEFSTEFVDKFPVQEEEEEEENGILSTEELNKKFDEFIRKMKEEIRVEAQQQLVMVN